METITVANAGSGEEIVDTTPTAYRVSTITCNGSLGTSVNLDKLFTHVRLTDGNEDKRFVWVEFGQDKNRGVYPKKRRPSVYGRKSFDNQVTLIYRFREGYAPNIKVFRNGNIQMTGIRCPEDGHRIIESIASEVRYIIAEVPEAAGIVDLGAMNPGDFKIRMINSDFSFTFRIRRKDLHTLLISSQYNTISSFQPGTYPGVKIQYFWNVNSRNRCGRCECPKPCHGRGDNAAPAEQQPAGAPVVAENQCKKVTISVFESGKILITGATSYAQIDEAYAYIVRVIQDNIGRIRKQSIPLV